MPVYFSTNIPAASSVPSLESSQAWQSSHIIHPVSSRQHGGPSADSPSKVSEFAGYLSSIRLGLENTWWKIFKPVPTVNIYKQLDDFLFLTLMMRILEGNRTHRIESQESMLSLKSIGRVSLQMGVSV